MKILGGSGKILRGSEKYLKIVGKSGKIVGKNKHIIAFKFAATGNIPATTCMHRQSQIRCNCRGGSCVHRLQVARLKRADSLRTASAAGLPIQTSDKRARARLAGVVGPLRDLGLVRLEVAEGVAGARLPQLDLGEGAVDLLGDKVGGAVWVELAEDRVLSAVPVDEPAAVEAVDELHPVEAPLRRDGRAEQAEGDGAVAELAEEGVLHAEAQVDVVDDLHLVLVLPLHHPLRVPRRQRAVQPRALRVEARRVPAGGSAGMVREPVERASPLTLWWRTCWD
jgi:hypothetical protein